MNTAEYWIEEAKQKTGATSQRKLAEKLNTQSGMLSDIKKGKTRMPFQLCKKIAEIIGEDEATILLSIMADKTKDEEERTALFQVIQRANPAAFTNLETATKCILC